MADGGGMAKPRTRRPGLRRVIEDVVGGALDGGMPVGSFKVVVENRTVTLLPIANEDDPHAGDAARRMREAFGDDARAPAIRR